MMRKICRFLDTGDATRLAGHRMVLGSCGKPGEDLAHGPAEGGSDVLVGWKCCGRHLSRPQRRRQRGELDDIEHPPEIVGERGQAEFGAYLA